MYQIQYYLFHLCCLKRQIQSLIDLFESYFIYFINLHLFNLVHLSQVSDCQLDYFHQHLVDFYSFIKVFFDQQLQPFHLKLLQDLQIFLFPYLKLTKFVLEQFCQNSIVIIAIIIEEEKLFYPGLIFYITHKLLEVALFHNQVIFLDLTNCFIKKTQLIFHNFSKFRLHRVPYTKLYYKVQDAKRMDHTYHFLSLDKF